MVKYATVGTNDPDAAKAFYDALLAPEGYVASFEQPSGGRLYHEPGGSLFGVLCPNDGKPASVGNGTMVGFALKDRPAVDAFYARAMALGAADEGAPGVRGPDGSPAYFAYFRDSDGNKLCAYNFAI